MPLVYKTNEQIMNDLKEMREQEKQLKICELDLQRIKRNYERLLESAPNAMVFINKGGTIVFANSQLEKLFGYREEELIGKDLAELIPERFRAVHRKNIESFFVDPGVRFMSEGREIFGRRKGGSEFPAEVSLSFIETDGDPLAIGDIRDITEKRRNERIIESNYMIQKVISSVLKVSLEPIPLDDQLERILDMILMMPSLSIQKGCIYLTEEDKEILVLKAPRQLPPHPPLPCERVLFGKCLCGRAASSRTVIFSEDIDDRHDIRHPGEPPHGHYCVPIVFDKKTLGLINIFLKEGHRRTPDEEEFLKVLAMTLSGILKHHRDEAERYHLTEQLAESEKMSALGRITANVAHEIRNPLTSIGGFTRRLHKKLADGTREKEYAGLIFSEVIRLESILRNALLYSRGVHLNLEECDLLEIIEKALKLYEEICVEQSIIVNKSFREAPVIMGDKEQILQAIENLISNAIDSMPGGGTLTVFSDKEVVKGVPYVMVKIKDTGHGIEKENLNRIFEPFFTTKLVVKGTGLGLTITKKILEDHGGFIRVESTIGIGSTFSIYFPYKTRQ